jgi:hypothetical protein
MSEQHEQQGDTRAAFLWHAMAIDEVVSQLHSDAATGLDSKQVEAQRAGAGPNIIVERQRRSWLMMFIAQFRDFMILVLLAAALVSGFIGEVRDTIAILVIVLLNAVIGAVQEFRAERAVAALRELTAPMAQVIRDGEPTSVPSADVVPGDLVLLEAGNIVPADLRLVRCNDLQLHSPSASTLLTRAPWFIPGAVSAWRLRPVWQRRSGRSLRCSTLVNRSEHRCKFDLPASVATWQWRCLRCAPSCSSPVCCRDNRPC